MRNIILCFFFSVLVIVSSCNNRRKVWKSITVNHQNGPGTWKSTTLLWFRESELTSMRDFVTLSINNVEDTVLIGTDSNIADIDLREDTIIIKARDLLHVGNYLKKKKVNKYKVVIKKATDRESFKSLYPDQPYFPINKKMR
jgi:hypothetical protein